MPVLAQVGDPVVHRGDDVRHPLALGVQRGPPGLHLHRLGAGLRQRRGDDLAGGVPPARRPGVGGEDDRPDDGVGQRLLVAVGVVGAADQAALALEAVLLVADEGDALVGLGAERRPGQAQPAGRAPEGLLGRLAPGEAVTGVVHLVEDHQRLDARSRGPRAASACRRPARRWSRSPGCRPAPVRRRWSGRGPARCPSGRRRRPTAAAGGRSGRRRRRGRPRGASSSRAASVRAKVVLPAPGVAVTRKSFGDCSSYCPSAACCHARSGRLVVCGLKASARAALPMIGSILRCRERQHAQPDASRAPRRRTDV